MGTQFLLLSPSGSQGLNAFSRLDGKCLYLLSQLTGLPSNVCLLSHHSPVYIHIRRLIGILLVDPLRWTQFLSQSSQRYSVVIRARHWLWSITLGDFKDKAVLNTLFFLHLIFLQLLLQRKTSLQVCLNFSNSVLKLTHPCSIFLPNNLQEIHSDHIEAPHGCPFSVWLRR